MTMFTALANDSDHSDDTAYRTTTVFVVMDTLVVPWAATAPTIDGVINSGEWSDALKLDVSDIMGEEGGPHPPARPTSTASMTPPTSTMRLTCRTVTGRGLRPGWLLYGREQRRRLGDRLIRGQPLVRGHRRVDTVLYRRRPTTDRWSGPPPNGVAMSSLTSGHLQYEAYVLKGTNQWDYTLNNPYGQDTVGFYAYCEVSGGTVFAGTWPTTMPGTDWDIPTDYGTMILSHSQLAVPRESAGQDSRLKAHARLQPGDRPDADSTIRLPARPGQPEAL